MTDTSELLRLAQRAYDAGDIARARSLCENVLALGKRNPNALYLMATILQDMDRLEEAGRYAERFIQLRPKEPGGHQRLGTILGSLGRYTPALARFDKVLKLSPGNPAAIDAKAYVYLRKGDYSKVEKLLGPYLKAGTENISMAMSYGKLLLHEGRLEEAADFLRRHIAAPDTARGQRRLLNFHLGKVLERAEDWDEAFAAYAAANTGAAARDNPPAYRARVDELMTIFSASAMSGYARADHGLDVPVLVVGMPRTGSTLIEEIIAMHPAAAGAGETHLVPDIVRQAMSTIGSSQPYPRCVGELTTESANTLGRAYVEGLAKAGRAASRVVDKNLLNYEQLGLIALIAPQSRVIDCRRDPMDTCLSCFMEPLAEFIHPYASDLAHLGTRYREYERLMKHWMETLDLEVLTLNYEELVADQEGQTRRVIEFLGLPWSDKCLKFHESKRAVRTLSHEQVKRPIYSTSVKRSERFAAHLEPLRQALASH